MKKWKDTTRQGHQVLSILGPDAWGDYAGVVLSGSSMVGVTWREDGSTCNGITRFDLVPAEPEVEYKYGTAFSTRSIGIGSEQYTKGNNFRLCFVDGKLVSAEVIK